MRNRVAAILLCLTGLCVAARGQAPMKRQLVVPLAEGAFVGFRNEASWIGNRGAAADSQLALAALTSQAIGDDHLVHRLLADASGKFVFGYDLLVIPDQISRRFSVVVKPLDRQYENRLSAGEVAPATISTFPKPTGAQALNDGDAFSLDLLVNQETGVKIVDVVKVTFDRASLREVDPRMIARDVTPDVVVMEMKDYSLLINDKLTATGKSKTGCEGPLLWVYIPGCGRFIFSLVPRPGYEFQKTGVVENGRIEFSVNGDRYEWFSSSPILRGDGAWNLWVLYDPNYAPLFGSEPAPPTKKNIFDKLGEIVGATQPPVKFPNQKTLTERAMPKTTTTTTPRPRVMVGGADRIEDLWPRNH